MTLSFSNVAKILNAISSIASFILTPLCAITSALCTTHPGPGGIDTFFCMMKIATLPFLTTIPFVVISIIFLKRGRDAQAALVACIPYVLAGWIWHGAPEVFRL